MMDGGGRSLLCIILREGLCLCLTALHLHYMLKSNKGINQCSMFTLFIKHILIQQMLTTVLYVKQCRITIKSLSNSVS